MQRIAYALTLALVFAIPWEQTIEHPRLGTVSRLIGVGAAAAWAVSVASSGRMRRLTPFHGVVLLFVIWNGLTVFWSVDPASTATGFVTYAQLLVMLVILWDLIDTTDRLRAVLQAYVLGGFVAVGGIVANFLTGETTVYLRYSSPGSDVDGAALIVALGIPAAIYLAMSPTLEHRSVALRLANFAYIPAAAFAIVLTGTRGAVLASLPTAIFLLWAVARGGRSRRVGVVVAAACATYLLVNVAPPASLERVASARTELAGGDLTGRVGIWRESIDAFLATPVLGVGHDAHRAAVPSGKVAHNTPLSILVETGLIGFLLLTAIVVGIVAALRRHSRWDAWYWTTQLSVAALGAMSLSVEDRKAIWALVALSLGAAAAAPARSRSPGDVLSALPTYVAARGHA